MDDYIVYIKIDEQNRVTEINSSAFITDTTDWIDIDKGTGDRYYHAQGNYLDNPLYTDDGVLRYKLDGESIVERTIEEIAEDVAAIPNTDQTDYESRITQLEEELAAAKILLGVE